MGTTERRPRKYRLAVVHSHPIEYLGPFFARLAKHPDLDLTVFYGSSMGVVPSYDQDFQVVYQWDRPLLDGYRYRFLKNVWPARKEVNSFWRIFNPELLIEISPRKFDAVLVYGWSMASFWLAFGACKLRRIPYLITADTVLLKEQPIKKSWIKRMIIGQLLRGAGAVLSMGEASEAFMKSHSVSSEKLFHVPLSPDIEYLQGERAKLEPQRDLLRRKYGIPPEACAFLYVGKLIESKRVQDLISAFSLCSSELHNVWLLISGDGPLRAGLETQVLEQGVKNVAFLGFKNQSEMPSVYALGDALVLPSAREAWGVVVNEAFACGLPVVLSDMTGAANDRRFFQDGKNGFVYKNGRYRSIEHSLKNFGQRQRIEKTNGTGCS